MYSTNSPLGCAFSTCQGGISDYNKQWTYGPHNCHGIKYYTE